MLPKPTLPQVSAGLQPGVGVRRELVDFICPPPPALPFPLHGAVWSWHCQLCSYLDAHPPPQRPEGPQSLSSSLPRAPLQPGPLFPFHTPGPVGKGSPLELVFAETWGKGHARSVSACVCKGTLTSGSRLVCGEARLSLVHGSVPWSPFPLGTSCPQALSLHSPL